MSKSHTVRQRLFLNCAIRSYLFPTDAAVLAATDAVVASASHPLLGARTYQRGDNCDPTFLESGRLYVYYTYMAPKARRKLTITVEDAVYRGLRKIVGPRNISRFLNDLARPHVVRERLDEGYRAMAGDETREAEAAEWSEELVGDVADEPR
jgi:hypothetical protein